MVAQLVSTVLAEGFEERNSWENASTFRFKSSTSALWKLNIFLGGLNCSFGFMLISKITMLWSEMPGLASMLLISCGLVVTIRSSLLLEIGLVTTFTSWESEFSRRNWRNDLWTLAVLGLVVFQVSQSMWMSDDSTLGQLDYRQLDYLTTRLMDKSTHGQVDSLTTRPIVIIHVRGIIFLPKSLNVMSSCAVKRSVQSPRRNKSRKLNVTNHLGLSRPYHHANTSNRQYPIIVLFWNGATNMFREDQPK